MVAGGDHGAHAVDASWKTASDDGLKETVAIAGVVDTFEEGEGCWIRRRSGAEGTDVLDCYVAVADDVTIGVEVLRCGVVVCGGVDEEAGVEVDGLHGDVEGCVGGDVVAWLGVCDHGGDHVLLGWDVAHWNAIAGATGDLLAVGDGLA